MDKFTYLILFVIVSGCSSTGDLCLLGRTDNSYSPPVDYDRPVYVDKNNKILSNMDKNIIIQQGNSYARKIVNQNYDIARDLCDNKEITLKNNQGIVDISYIYAKSRAAPWMEWNDKKRLYTSGLYRALYEKNLDKVIDENLCVIGLCNKKDIAQFCATNQRPYLKKESFISKLRDHYIRDHDIEITYPHRKITYYCKQPKLLGK
ncbi:hypothetical protein [Wohlfahrtiimonas populi]|uniref:hypothetical protein n=1 Tax=Wohlfahrtiimonas populi TaxID=1940240 RepID=UPI00098D21DA|nr:hypothetical protein [Wohlfahrtiimonas populi]